MVWMFGIPQGQRCRLDASKAYGVSRDVRFQAQRLDSEQIKPSKMQVHISAHHESIEKSESQQDDSSPEVI